jgi:hypothetical protein
MSLQEVPMECESWLSVGYAVMEGLWAMEGYLDERSSRAWAYCYVMPSTSPPTCGHFVLPPSLDQAAWGMRWLKRQQHARTPLRGSSWSTHSRLGPDPLCRISIPRPTFFHAYGRQVPQLPCHAISQ